MEFKCKYCDSEVYQEEEYVIKKKANNGEIKEICKYELVYCSECECVAFLNLISGIIPQGFLNCFKSLNIEAPEIKYTPSG